MACDAAGWIGWIGLGNLGSRMAPRLLGFDRPVHVFDVDSSRIATLVAQGATQAGSVGEVAKGASLVFTSLPSDAVLLSVTGPDGLAGAMPTGTCVVDTSTVSPEASAQAAAALASRGISLLRAPVSGSTLLAAEGRLTMFVSGDELVFTAAQPLLNRIARKVTYVGPAEEARVIKLVINLVIAVTNGALAEALDLGRRSGLDWATMIDALADSVAASPYLLSKVGTLKERDWTPAGTVAVIAKDMDIALQLGRQGGAYLPLAALARQSLAALEGRGGSGLDLAAVVTLLDQ